MNTPTQTVEVAAKMIAAEINAACVGCEASYCEFNEEVTLSIDGREIGTIRAVERTQKIEGGKRYLGVFDFVAYTTTYWEGRVSIFCMDVIAAKAKPAPVVAPTPAQVEATAQVRANAVAAELAAAKIFTVLGTTEAVTACDCCGRTGLKLTIALRDNETNEVRYFGSACGARAIGWTAKELDKVAYRAQADRTAALCRRLNELTAPTREAILAELFDANERGVFGNPRRLLAIDWATRKQAALNKAWSVASLEFPGLARPVGY